MFINMDPNDFKREKLIFGDVFSEAQQLYWKLLGIGALTVVIYLFASGIVGFLFESITGFKELTQSLAEDIQGSQDINRIWQKAVGFYSENTGIALITRFGTELIMLLSFPLAGGFMLACRQMDKEGYASASVIFEGFKPEYWARLMVLALVYFVLSKIGMMLLLIPGIYIWVAAVLGCPFVMFGGKSGVEALKSSVDLVNKEWFTVFKILLVATLIGWSGYLLCGIGRIVTYPFIFVTIYIMYKHMVGFTDDHISEIGKE